MASTRKPQSKSTEEEKRSHLGVLAPRADRAGAGRTLREKVPRTSHSVWKLVRSGRDPIDILAKSNRWRLADLVPLRYGRMSHSPFAFLRGSAAVMAYDLAKTPVTGLRVQACGDCHLLNFGLFATPERHLVFDVNDFDETHPAPWEWDLKRLAASFVVAARESRLSASEAADIVMGCARAYREHMRECSHLTPMDLWYQRLDWETAIELAPDAKARKFRKQLGEQARQRVIEHLFPKITKETGRRFRLVDQAPLLFHVEESDFAERVHLAMATYRESLSEERRVLFDRYRLEDFALKVVGVGSVGMRCYVALMVSDEGHPLILQFKEAVRSVLEPYTQRSAYENQGQRVVIGQRLMQSSSDIFLGWARGRRGKDFYVRQLRDMKMSIPLEHLDAGQLTRYAEGCAWTLARAHAKSGDAAAIIGYLGKGEVFDRALAKFAHAYADQTERDYAALLKAIRSGRVRAVFEE